MVHTPVRRSFSTEAVRRTFSSRLGSTILLKAYSETLPGAVTLTGTPPRRGSYSVDEARFLRESHTLVEANPMNPRPSRETVEPE